MDRSKTIAIPEDYFKYKEEFIYVLTPYQSMWDRHLGRISTIKHRVDLESPIIRPMDLVPYRIESKARDFKRSEIETMLVMNIIEPAKTEWASLVDFPPKKDGTMRFCVD